jgi:hypothetical protein
MQIKVTCSECEKLLLLTFEQLYTLWKELYDTLCAEHKDKLKARIRTKCNCGHTELYESYMFNYVFQLIVDELVKENKVA